MEINWIKLKMTAILINYWSKYKHKTCRSLKLWCSYYSMWAIKHFYNKWFFYLLHTRKLESKNLDTKVRYGVPRAQIMSLVCVGAVEKVMVKWEKIGQVNCYFFGHEAHGGCHGLMANAMSLKWWTWLVEGSWRTPCPYGERHTL